MIPASRPRRPGPRSHGSTSCFKGFERELATSLIARLAVERVSEDNLKQILVDRFRASLLGTDPDTAFDLLSFWIYLKSEARVRLTGADAKSRVENVASCLADIGARRCQATRKLTPKRH